MKTFLSSLFALFVLVAVVGCKSEPPEATKASHGTVDSAATTPDETQEEGGKTSAKPEDPIVD